MKDSAHTSTEEVVRAFVGRDVGRLLTFDPVTRAGRDDEGVHQLRVSVRHLRSELNVVSAVLARDAHRVLDRELRWLGRALGARRDLDVMASLFSSLESKDVRVPRLVRERLEADRAREARRLMRVMESARYRRLIRRLGATVVAPPLTPRGARRADAVLRPGLVKVAIALFAEVDAAGASPGTETLHRIRIRAKRCRYSCEISSGLLPGASEATRDLEKVQSVLGDVHDHVVALAYLDETLGPDVAPGANADLDATRHALAKSLGRLRSRWRAPLERARRALDPLLDAQTNSSTG